MHSPAGPSRRPRAVLVGPVPPPVTGKCVMVEALGRSDLDSLDIALVGTQYSGDLGQIGRLSVGKAVEFVRTLVRTVAARVRFGARVLIHNPPAAERGLIVRDAVFLALMRPLFATVVFHVHGRGLPGGIESLPAPLRWLARRAFRSPDLLIAPSAATVDDCVPLQARAAVVVANGTESGRPRRDHARRDAEAFRVLYLNTISEEKGALVLLRALARLRDSGHSVHATFAGAFRDADARTAFETAVDALGLTGSLRVPGVVVGNDKWALFDDADVFCVPSFASYETFGLAMVEAASCALPIVLADTPGPDEVFRADESAVLVPPDDAVALAAALERLVDDGDRRAALGSAARQVYEERYTMERFRDRMDLALADIDTGAGAT